MPTAREKASFVAYGEKFVLYGGLDEKRICGDVWIFNHHSHQYGTWSRGVELRDGARYGQSMVYVEHIGFLVYGGRTSTNFDGDCHWIKIGVDDKIEYTKIPVIGASPSSRTEHGCTLVDKVMFVFGGVRGMKVLDDLWCFDINSNIWTHIEEKGICPLPRSGPLLSRVDNYLILYGGVGSNSDIWLYHLGDKVWVQHSTLNEDTEIDIDVLPKPGLHGFSFVSYLTNVLILGGKVSRSKDAFPISDISLIITNFKSDTISYGNWIFKSRIGGGTYGDVLKVYRKDNLTEFFALKLFKESQRDNLSKMNDELKEVLSQSKLNHPNCLSILDVFVNHVSLCVIMPLCEYSLSHYLTLKKSEWDQIRTKKSERKRVEFEGSLLRLCLGIVKGMEYIHSNGMLHLDLKLENILMSYEDVSQKGGLNTMIPKISDFGFTRKLLDSDIRDSRGTPGYIAPECINNGHCIASDVFSFGVILYCIFSLSSGAVLTKDLEQKPLIHEIEANFVWGKKYSKWIQRCCDPDPKMRPGSLELFKMIKSKYSLLVGKRVNYTNSIDLPNGFVDTQLPRDSTRNSRTSKPRSSWQAGSFSTEIALRKLNLVEYEPLFEKKGFQMTQSFIGVNPDSVQKLGIENPFHRAKLMNYLTDSRRDPIDVKLYQDWIVKCEYRAYSEKLVVMGYDSLSLLVNLTDSEISNLEIPNLKQSLVGIILPETPLFHYVITWLNYLNLCVYREKFIETDKVNELFELTSSEIDNLVKLIFKGPTGHAKQFLIALDQQRTLWNLKKY